MSGSSASINRISPQLETDMEEEIREQCSKMYSPNDVFGGGTSFNQMSVKSELIVVPNDLDGETEEEEIADFGQECLQTTLHQAARDGSAALIVDILKYKYKNKKDRKFAINKHDCDNMTPLHYAAKYARKEVAELLIDRGADPTAKGDDGCLALHFAVKYRPSTSRIASTSARENEEDSEVRRQYQSHIDDTFLETLTFILQETIKASSKNDSKSVSTKDSNIIDSDDDYGDSPLHYAVARGNHKAAEILLANGADANDTDNQGMTPIYMAAKNGNIELLTLLLTYKADLSMKEEDGTTAIHIAASEGHLQLLHYCFDAIEKESVVYNGMTAGEAVANALQDTDNEGANTLHYTIESEDLTLTKYIIYLIRKYKKKELINSHRLNGDTALHLAAEKGNLDIVRELVRSGARLDPYNSDRETPLFIAAKNNKIEVIEYLAKRKPCSVSKPDGDGWSALLIAASNGHLDAAIILLNNGADHNDKDRNDQTIVFIAASEGHTNFLRELMKRREITELVNERDQYQNTPCHTAAQNGYRAVLNVLIKSGADVSLKNDEEQTGMHKAAQFGKPDIIKMLHRTDPKLIHDWDENSDLPIHIAATNGKLQCVKTLIELGSEIDAQNTKGWTPLDCAAATGANEVCQELIDNDAPIDALDRSKVTPLHLACKGGHSDTVALLLKNNADCTLTDSEGRNCLDYAVDYYREECVEILLKSDQWEECLSNAFLDPNTDQYVTPMRKLIQHLPEQAEIVFNRCITVIADKTEYTLQDAPRKSFEVANLKIKFNYNYLDDDYLVGEWIRDRSDALSDTYTIVEEPELETYSSNTRKIIENHPLTYLICNNRQNLISHPLVTSLYNSKWSKVGFYVYYTNLSIYLVFMILLNVYAMTIPPPFSYDTTRFNSATEACPSGMIPVIEDAQELWRGEDGCYKIPGYRNWVIWVVIISGCFRMLFEITQIVHEQIEYFLDLTNMLEWCLYVFTILFVVDFKSDNGYPDSMREPWQWQLGAVGVWLSWMVLLLFIQKLPKLGIYILMFNTVIRTFLSFALIFILFLLGFAISFFMLLQNQVPFDTIGKSFTKSLIMMIGEFEYEGIFAYWETDLCTTGEVLGQDCEVNDWTEINFYHRTMFVMFVIFVVTMTIIISNMLVGLAVDDIKAVQDTAVLKRQALKIKLALEAMYQAPPSWRAKWQQDKKRKTISLGKSKYPNISRLQNWLDPDSRITRQKIRDLQHHDKDDLEEVWESIDELNDNLSRARSRVTGVDRKVSKIEQMMELLINHHGIDISDIAETD